jgi:hypothetical protein
MKSFFAQETVQAEMAQKLCDVLIDLEKQIDDWNRKKKAVTKEMGPFCDDQINALLHHRHGVKISASALGVWDRVQMLKGE